MASITATTSLAGTIRTVVYTITDMQNNAATVTAVGQLVTIAQTVGVGLLKDGQAELTTLLLMLQSGQQPLVQQHGASSFASTPP